MKKPLAATAYDQLKSMIETGSISPGKSLIENNLCELLEMSRTPIREALNRLFSEGFVEYEKNKGYTVATFSTEKIQQIYEAIEANEGMLMYLLAAGYPNIPLGDIRCGLEDMEAALEKQDWDAWVEADTRCHQAFYAGCTNEYIKKNLDILNKTALQVRIMITKLYLNKEESTRSHREIYEAIAKGEAELARVAAQKHFSWVRHEVIACMKKFSMY